MQSRTIVAAGSLWLLAALSSGRSHGDEVRLVEEGGITYRETVRTVQQPVAETEMQQRQTVVYTERQTTEMRESLRTGYTPVTEYHWEPRWHGWWNPFQPAHVAYHLVPRTHWQPVTERVRTPVSYREWVPETRTVEVPVRKLRFVEQERVVSRIAVDSARPQAVAPARTARRIGGISQMDSDPPRQGVFSPQIGGTVLR